MIVTFVSFVGVTGIVIVLIASYSMCLSMGYGLF
jgi:hypothetical protein